MTAEQPAQQTYLPPVKVSPWRHIGSAVLYFLIYMTCQLAVSLAYTIYLLGIAPAGLSEAELNHWVNARFFENSNLLMMVLYALLLAVLVIVSALRKKNILHELGMKKPRIAALPIALVAGIGMSCLVNVIMTVIASVAPQIMEDYSSTMDATYNMQDVFLYVLTGVIGAPLIEELFFRHLMAGRLSRAMPKLLAILLSSAVFGLVHEHPVQWIYAGLLGILMASVYFAYDSLLPAVVLHAGFNSVSLLSFIDTSKMSREDAAGLDALIGTLILVFAIVGVAALILLFILRTHPVFVKTPAEEAPVLLAAPVAFPTVADFADLDRSTAQPAESAPAPGSAPESASDEEETV